MFHFIFKLASFACFAMEYDMSICENDLSRRWMSVVSCCWQSFDMSFGSHFVQLQRAFYGEFLFKFGVGHEAFCFPYEVISFQANRLYSLFFMSFLEGFVGVFEPAFALAWGTDDGFAFTFAQAGVESCTSAAIAFLDDGIFHALFPYTISIWSILASP